MITQKQEKWLNSLDEGKIKIVPYDPTAPEKFKIIKERIESFLGSKFEVVHRGATSLGISGQDEIDVYVPVSPNDFDTTLLIMEKSFGKPRSLYTLERARFMVHVDSKKIDLFLINNVSQGWLDGVKFETYLKKNPEVLERYCKLKESMNGFSTKEFYKKKIEFINGVLNNPA